MNSIIQIVNDPLRVWELGPAAPDSSIQELLNTLGFSLPDEYLDFMRLANGGEGELGIWPGWFILWAIENVVEWNKDYEVADRYPGFLAFGSNGGGEMLAFDLRNQEPFPVVALPHIGFDAEDAMFVAHSFHEFVNHLGKKCQN